MANEVEIVVTGQDRSGPAFDSARRNAKSLGSEGGSALEGLTGKVKGLGVAALASAAIIGVELAKKALGALIDYSKRSIDAASNLNESVNAVNKIFGTSSEVIMKWGKDQANAYGLSQRAFNEMATPLGALLKNQGVAQKDLAQTTIDLTKRAADLASVFNTTVPDALEALTAGLRGETDPLERYGVSLTAARVEAEALAETGKKTASSLTDQEKATARLNLIMQQTNDSAGDFQQTSDGLANSTRILQARQEELQATIGQKLLPLMTALNQVKLEALEYIANNVLPKVEEGAKLVFDAFRKVWEEALPKLQELLEVVKEKWDENKDSIEKLTPFLEYLGAFLGITLVAALVTVGGLIGLFIEYLGNVGDTLSQTKQGFDVFVVALLGFFGRILDGAVLAFSWIPGIGDKLKGAQAAFHSWADSIINDIKRTQAVASQGIGVNIKVGGLSQLSQAIADVVWLSQHSVVAQGIGTKATGGIVGAASGKITSGSLTLVGEQGPELVSMPAGSKVYSAGQSKAMMNDMSGGGWGSTVNVYVQGSIISEREIISLIRDELQRLGWRGLVTR